MKLGSNFRPVARSLLANDAYDIEFNGYLTNHVKHAIVALERLEAPETRVQEYWDTYTTLTPYSLPLHTVETAWKDVKPATIDQWKAWKGKKIHWQEQVAFLNQELEARQGDTHQLVVDYAPDILSGMAGALTHTIIHLGWAIDAQSPWMTTEGLAYLNFAHVGIDDDKLVWDVHEEEDPVDSFWRVATTWQEQNLQKMWIEVAKASYDQSFRPELVPAGFQWEVAKVLDRPHAAAVELPTWIMQRSVSHIWESLYRTTVYLYLATRDSEGNGNFVVLHLMSSLWGLQKTLEAIDQEAVTRKAIAHYFASVVCLLSTASGGFPSPKSLDDARTLFPPDKVDAADLDWAPIVKSGIAEEEEHNIKLVYMMKELWNRYDHWSAFSDAARSFTLTPNIGPAKPVFKA